MADYSNIGTFVDQATAINDLNAFLATVPDPNDPNLAVAFMFGLDKLTKVFDKIASHNKATKDENEKITAVRFYRAITTNKDGTPKDDLIVMPVKANGEDLTPIYKQGGTVTPVQKSSSSTPEGSGDGDSDGSLTDSDPCPNNCQD